MDVIQVYKSTANPIYKSLPITIEPDDEFPFTRAEKIKLAHLNTGSTGIIVDTEVISGSTNPVSGGAVYSKIASLPTGSTDIIVDTEVVSGSTNPVSGGAVYSKIASLLTGSTVESFWESDTISGSTYIKPKNDKRLRSSYIDGLQIYETVDDNNIKLQAKENAGVAQSLIDGLNFGDNLTLKQKLIGSDNAIKVNGLTEPSQEISLISFNGKHYVYYTTGWGYEHVNVAEYNITTHTAFNNSVAVDSNLLGITSAIVKCGYAFVFNSKVYIVVTCWNPNYCFLLSSIDGITFTVVSGTIVDSISNFKNGMYGNHCIIPYKIDGYYYWFIEGRETTSGTSAWIMKLMKSTQMESGWEMVGQLNNLATGSIGGGKIFYDQNMFKMFYHYSDTANPPSILGYAESDINNPLYFKKKYYPLLSITRQVYISTDQIADPEIVEVNNGKTLMFAEYVDNSRHTASIYVWESEYRIHDILNSALTDIN